ncbi:MAG: 3-oxoacyl-ACP reductase [Gammaproteobacteria bacterium]|jgi:3-oxoacyl-[acyl-carrier protein] reductase|nr:3-oxoacyl-ACP reductase [Gammaproteobacteria bacterium]
MENKKAIVTGGNRGIGKGIVLGLIEQGYTVLATCRNISNFDYSHAKLSLANLDISDASSVENFQKTVSEFEPNILINNAGITKDNLFLRMSDEDWENVINTNLNGVFKITKLVVKGMLKKRWGRIINISSVSGSMGNPGQTNYSASKAGVDALTRSLAKELGSRNITVNSIAPGFIETDMTEGVIDQQILDKIPLKRAGKPEDIASLVNFLSSEESNYITGQTLVVDGGLFMK